MADKKDNKPEEKDSKPALTTSSSLDKPLLDENTTEKSADIDTSHLSIDDSTAQTSRPLGKDSEETPASISTSHLNLKSEAEPAAGKQTGGASKPTKKPVANKSTAGKNVEADKPAGSNANDEALIINNPLANKAASEATLKIPDPTPDDAQESEQVMLTTDVPDEEFDKDIQADTTKNDTAENNNENDKADSAGPIKAILDTVKKPETAVRDAWSGSSARRYLLDNVDSYREKDEEQNMEDVIEKMYGGAVEGKFSPGKFLKQNILFSFLIFILLFLISWKTAGILFPDFMPAINDQIIETVKKQTSRKPKTKPDQESKPIVINTVNKQIIDTTLSHCLVEPAARAQFAIAFSKVGYEYSNKYLTIAYEEMRDSTKVWDGLNMELYIKNALLRFAVLSELALPVVIDARKTVFDYDQSLMLVRERVKELEDSIRAIKSNAGHKSTESVNERRPLRNELDKLKTRLAKEPRPKRLIQLLAKLTLAEEVLMGTEIPNRVKPDQVTKKDPKWITAISEAAVDEIAAPINNKVLPTILTPAEKLKDSTPKLAAYQLSELNAALDKLLKLSSLIIFTPENKLISYKLELTGLNRRMKKLMKKDLPYWINADQCLATQRAEAITDIK